MHDIGFIRDLAIVMLVAGVTTVIFQRLRLPVLLGYILAGVLIGPHMPVSLVADERAIRNISDLGVVLLMFTLGLEFSVRKLRAVGAAALVATTTEVILMLWIGYEVGRLFGWNIMDSLFLGAIMSISSTMIATRLLGEAGHRDAPHGRLVIGILVGEDMLAVVLIALLSGIALTGQVEPGETLAVIGRLMLFVLAMLILGLLVLPRLIDYVARFRRDEMLVVVALGICFGASLLAVELGFSVALGAFLSGAVVAEARHSARVVHLMEPLRDMFGALFFVAIGLMIDPALVLQYALPAALVAVAVIIGKTLTCSFGALITGHPAPIALRTGLGLAQIGEFSFVIASLGLSLGVISGFVYPIAVSVSAVCMIVAPFLLRHADDIVGVAHRVAPRGLRSLVSSYTGWIADLRPVNENAVIAAMLRRFLFHIFVNVALVVTLFLLGAYVNTASQRWFPQLDVTDSLRRSVIWSAALLLSMPMLIATYRKADALGMLLAELGIRESFAGPRTEGLRRVLAKLIPLATLVILALLVGALGSAILPPREVLYVLLVLFVALALFLWRALVRMHARVQAAIKETLEKQGTIDNI